MRVFSVLRSEAGHKIKKDHNRPAKRMEEKQLSGGHKIWISGRKNGIVTGITDVLAFDETEILMDTELGMLSIKGKGLHISKLNLEKGEADLEGQVDSLTYSAKGHKKKKEGSLLQRMMS